MTTPVQKAREVLIKVLPDFSIDQVESLADDLLQADVVEHMNSYQIMTEDQYKDLARIRLKNDLMDGLEGYIRAVLQDQELFGG